MTQLRVGLRYEEVAFGDIVEVVAVGPTTHTIRLVHTDDEEAAAPIGSERQVPNVFWELDFLPAVATGQYRILEDADV